jgi:hypothetical protein
MTLPPEHEQAIRNAIEEDVAASADIKTVPAADSSADARRSWLTRAFTARGIGPIARYGGVSSTPMTVEVIDLLGVRRVVRFEHEDDAAKHGPLRAELIRQGAVRAGYITNAKIAGDAYFLMCSLAQVVGGVDPLDEVREYADGYRLEGRRLEGLSFAKGDLYTTLDTIRTYPYSKHLINVWLNALERGDYVGDPPQPPLVIDRDGGEWTSITHFGCYVRWGRDQPGTIRNDALAGRVVELGGRRWLAKAWEGTTRARRRRIITVLVRFPDDGEGGV